MKINTKKYIGFGVIQRRIDSRWTVSAMNSKKAINSRSVFNIKKIRSVRIGDVKYCIGCW